MSPGSPSLLGAQEGKLGLETSNKPKLGMFHSGAESRTDILQPWTCNIEQQWHCQKLHIWSCKFLGEHCSSLTFRKLYKGMFERNPTDSVGELSDPTEIPPHIARQV